MKLITEYRKRMKDGLKPLPGQGYQGANVFSPILQLLYKVIAQMKHKSQLGITHKGLDKAKFPGLMGTAHPTESCNNVDRSNLHIDSDIEVWL